MLKVFFYCNNIVKMAFWKLLMLIFIKIQMELSDVLQELIFSNVWK